MSRPFKVNFTLPGNRESFKACVPWETVAVMTQLPGEQDPGVVRVIVGDTSLQLWTSSVGAGFELVDAVEVPLTFAFPPEKVSTFQKLALLLAAVWRAAGGVQLVLSLIHI